jgi:ubiquinone/menaquinone biosynthesis C-methylase UbiE
LSTLDEKNWLVLKRYGVLPTTRPGWPWVRAVIYQIRAIVRESSCKIFRALIGRGHARSQEQIIAEYGKQWRKKGFERYRPQNLAGQGAPWIWKSFRFLLSNEGGAALRLIFLEHAIAKAKPKSVLEVGCGNGLNLHLLAARFPEVEFTGLEATAEGCAAGQHLAKAGHLPEDLCEFAPFEIKDRKAVSRVRIINGSAASLPFPERNFDLVMTSLALEQMEEIRSKALSEVVRVASNDVAMLEPFADVNRGFLQRQYVRTYDYFQGAIQDLENYGLEVSSVMSDMPHKAWLNTAMVMARRKAR